MTFGRDVPPDQFAPEKQEKTGIEDAHQNSLACTVKKLLAAPAGLLLASAILGGLVGGPLVAAGLLIGIPLANVLLGKPHASLASLVGITGGVVLILRSIARTLSPKKAQTRSASVSPSIPVAPSSPATASAPYIAPIQAGKPPLPVGNPFSPSKPLPGETLTIPLPTPQPSHPALLDGMPLHQLTRPIAFILMDPHEGKASLLIYRPATRQFQVIERPANFLASRPSTDPRFAVGSQMSFY
jgi:hypothetical protein